MSLFFHTQVTLFRILRDFHSLWLFNIAFVEQFSGQVHI